MGVCYCFHYYRSIYWGLCFPATTAFVAGKGYRDPVKGRLQRLRSWIALLNNQNKVLLQNALFQKGI